MIASNPVIDAPTPAVLIPDAPRPGNAFVCWFKEHVAGTLLTMIVGAAIGVIGSWYTLQGKVADQERRVAALELKAAGKDELRQALDAIRDQNASIDRRLSNIEGSLMADRSPR